MDQKIPQKGAWWGPWAEFINVWILTKLGTGKARDFKFGTRIDVDMSHLTDNKIVYAGRSIDRSIDRPDELMYYCLCDRSFAAAGPRLSVTVSASTSAIALGNFVGHQSKDAFA